MVKTLANTMDKLNPDQCKLKGRVHALTEGRKY